MNMPSIQFDPEVVALAMTLQQLRITQSMGNLMQGSFLHPAHPELAATIARVEQLRGIADTEYAAAIRLDQWHCMPYSPRNSTKRHKRQ
jgi:hypothetical protein